MSAVRKRSIAPIITWLAASFIILVVIIVPTGHFFVSYQYIKGSLVTEAEINADAVNRAISTNPEMWEFEQERLEEYLSLRPAQNQPDSRKIYGSQGTLVAESASTLLPPLMTVSRELFDSGVAVGRIEISRSLRPLVMETGLLILMMLPLGVGAFLTLRLMPIRTLYRTERSLWNTNEFLNRVMESTTNSIAVVNRQGIIVHANKRSSAITGYETTELIGRSYSLLIPGPLLPAVVKEARRVMSGGDDVHNLETQLLRKDGSLRSIACGISPLMQDDRNAGVVVSAEDITDRKEAEEGLREAKERYARIVEDMPDFICRYGPDMIITFVNEAFARHVGTSPEELAGTSYLDLLPVATQEPFRTAIASLNPALPVGSRELEVSAPDGDQRWHLWRDRAFFNSRGAIIEVQSIGQDITERKQMEERLHTLSITDELTSLYNRRGFYTMVEQQLKIAKRHRTGALLLSADLDNLKMINDTWGHQEGDAALVEAANIIRTCFRESDIVARVGGDEFVVFQLSTPDTSPDVLIGRLQKKLDRHNAEKNGGYRLSLSIGISRLSHDSRCSIDEMLDQADKLMYEKKREKQKNQE